MASLLEDLRKKAMLEMLAPGAYGYYAHSKGIDPKKAAIRGAIIGSSINTIKALGKLSKGESETKDLLVPITGAALGAGAAFGIYKAQPAIKKFIAEKRLDRFKELKEKVENLSSKI